MADNYQTGGEHAPQAKNIAPEQPTTQYDLGIAQMGTGTNCPLNDKGDIGNKP